MRVWGEGPVAVSAAVDFRLPNGGQQLALGVSPDLWGDGTDPTDLWGDGTDPDDVWSSGTAIDDDWVNWAWRGEHFSIRLGSIAQERWSVQRLEHHVGVVERPSADARV
jgi:hypothetical protein